MLKKISYTNEIIIFVLIVLTLTLSYTLGKHSILFEYFVPEKSQLSYHETIAKKRGMVPMLEPGENLAKYKQRVIEYMYLHSKPPQFDNEYIKSHLDHQKKFKPLAERNFFGE